jgi:hypothetical protein
MESSPKRIILREFNRTEVCLESDPGAQKVTLPDGGHYFYKPKLTESERARRDNKPLWVTRVFSAYPLVMKADGSPWDEVNAWILSRLDGEFDFDMSTYRLKAEDLQQYRNFVDSRGFDWLDFPVNKLQRPTYRHRGYLNVEIDTGSIAESTAQRRQGNVIAFYRWLINQGYFKPAFTAWEEGDVYIPMKDRLGRAKIKRVKTTDASIKRHRTENAYDPYIDDGGKLRPLSKEEQDWIAEALNHCGNTEMTLIHAIALTTGARMQTILTIRKKHILEAILRGKTVLLPCGSDGIDTKGNVKLTLQFPRWLMEQLRVYALSDRAKKRRLKAPGGDFDEQYLFLSERGTPLYDAKVEKRRKIHREIGSDSSGRKLKHVKNGQGVRQYIKEFILPYIHEKYDPEFHYQFHDLRATFGMNLVDERQPQMNSGELTYTAVLLEVQARMCHKSPTTTELYLQYRKKRKLFDAAQDGWEGKLQGLVDLMMVAA